MAGMFRPAEPNNRFSRKEMEEQLQKAGSTCKLCGTRPNQFVYAQYTQTVWCPRCGMPPIPQPQFMKEENR